MQRDKDPELHTFATGMPGAESPKSTLKEALTGLGRAIRKKPYLRSEAQQAAAKRVSDRIMGERDDS